MNRRKKSEKDGSVDPDEMEKMDVYVDTPDTTNTREKRRIMKNIIILGIGFLMNYIAYYGLARLQSTLHREEGLGVINQSVLYVALILSCLFCGNLIISLCGQKWAVCFGMAGYVIWMAANAYPVWGTMVPASIIVGIAGAPMWAGQSSYVAKIGARYAAINKEVESVVISRFFGISFAFYQCSSILGSIVAYVILSQEQRNQTGPLIVEHCGISDCPGKNQTNANLKKPEAYLIWILVGTYVAIACAGVAMLMIFLDKLPPDLRDPFDRKEIASQTFKRLKATLFHLRKREQLLLLPLTIYSGLEQSYYNADFTNSFIGCPLGTYMVGLVLFPAFIVSGITCVFSGLLVKYTGRVPLFITGFLVDLTHHMVMRLWQPDPNKLYVFFFMACCWGISQGIWQSQINGLYGYVFRDETEAAFSSYRLWDSIGCAVGYGWSNFLCVWQKLAILTTILCVGIVGYLIAEVLLYRENRPEKETEKKDDVGISVGDQEKTDG